MKKIIIRPKNRQKTSYYLKASQEHFLCPSNCVLTGRCHSGDENGKTWYEYAELEAVDENGETRYQTGLLKCNGKLVKVVPYPLADMCVYASSGKTVYPKDNLVIIGIKHSGDENGITTYCQGYIVVEK